jgi:hypothetical protein
MTVRRARYEIGYREFLGWLVYLDERDNEFTLSHAYLAQIAAEVRRTIATDSKAVDLMDFKLKYERQATKAKTKEERTEGSKAFWAHLAGATYTKKK